MKKRPKSNGHKQTDGDQPERKPAEPTYGEWVRKRGALQLTFRDGKAVWKYLPLRYGVRKASKAEAREFMKQMRNGLGLVTINKKRRSA